MTGTQEVAAGLRVHFRGDILQPGDLGFQEASKIWNGMVQRTPGLVLRCADVADVQAAVRAADSSGLVTAVRCGGHSLAGFSTCDGGIVIHLSRLRQVIVDGAKRKARAQGGCLLGNIDHATQAAGLVFPSGVVSHTGASGLILGGGTGWLTRLLGLSCDNVEGFTLVTADGSLVRANERENHDLFWALRGGGGNFGIVTEFELRLHPLKSVLLCTAWRFGDDVPRLLRFWRDYTPDAPKELKWNISLLPAPAISEIPSAFHGRAAAAESIVWSGDEATGYRCLSQILSLGHPVGVKTNVISYRGLQTMADAEFPHGARYYTKSGYFNSLDDSSIERMVESIASIPSPTSQIELAYLAGDDGKIGDWHTAFGNRTAPFIMNILGHWRDPAADSSNVGWVRSLFAALRPHMQPGACVNFMSGDEEGRVTEVYSAHWERLLAIKKAYDPRNLFRMNQNIVEHPKKGAASDV